MSIFLEWLGGGFSPIHLKNTRKSNWIISPKNRGDNKKYLSCHQPVICIWYHLCRSFGSKNPTNSGKLPICQPKRSWCSTGSTHLHHLWSAPREDAMPSSLHSTMPRFSLLHLTVEAPGGLFLLKKIQKMIRKKKHMFWQFFWSIWERKPRRKAGASYNLTRTHFQGPVVLC